MQPLLVEQLLQPEKRWREQMYPVLPTRCDGAYEKYLLILACTFHLFATLS